MKYPPVIFFLGKKRFHVPHIIYISILWLLVAANLLTVFHFISTPLLHISPVIFIPTSLQTIGFLISYLTLIGALLLAIMMLLGRWENFLHGKRFNDFQSLIPLSELCSLELTLAPNLNKKNQVFVIKKLQYLINNDSISSILALVNARDIEDGSVDRLFVTTKLSTSDFRKALRSLKCDDIYKVPDSDVGKIENKATLGVGTLWLLTWD